MGISLCFWMSTKLVRMLRLNGSLIAGTKSAEPAIPCCYMDTITSRSSRVIAAARSSHGQDVIISNCWEKIASTTPIVIAGT